MGMGPPTKKGTLKQQDPLFQWNIAELLGHQLHSEPSAWPTGRTPRRRGSRRGRRGSGAGGGTWPPAEGTRGAAPSERVACPSGRPNWACHEAHRTGKNERKMTLVNFESCFCEMSKVGSLFWLENETKGNPWRTQFWRVEKGPRGPIFGVLRVDSAFLSPIILRHYERRVPAKNGETFPDGFKRASQKE